MRAASLGALGGGALLELRGATRRYVTGGQQIYALRGIDLDIHAGEMVALVGASGSGKSSLMNILGCLDRLTEGSYRVAGRDTSDLDPDQLAELRRSHFGFVFQRYNLLPQLTAEANMEIPAIYAGMGLEERRERAGVLLERLGLERRLDHYPNQLSGGQQQRVSIGRALMNGGAVILADEPTGALDSATGREVMELLQQLNGRGHTLIVATHDHAVAYYAHRIVEVADGAIVIDRATERERPVAAPPLQAASAASSTNIVDPVLAAPPAETNSASPPLWVPGTGWSRFGEAAHMAAVALFAHRLRTSLTLLGVVIGIVSVTTMIALGESARRVLADDIKGLSTNTLEIYPGKDWGDPDSARIQTLASLDVEALRQQPYVKYASPQLAQSTLLRRRAFSGSGIVAGVGSEYFEMSGLPIEHGQRFSRDDVLRQAQVVVINPNVQERFFGATDPLGETLYVGKLPCLVIGVTGRSHLQESRFGSKLNVWLPFTTASSRLIGRGYLDSIVVSLRDAGHAITAEEQLTSFLAKRHRTKDFMVFNMADRIKTDVQFMHTVSIFLAAIGIISLTVGGIGVMNIMLVSVSERAREIGVRIAVGARQGDIRRQFLIEAVIVCLTGAAVGVILSYFMILIAEFILPPKWEMHLSISAILAAVVSATVTGVVFGYFPARNAARLDPVEALARD